MQEKPASSHILRLAFILRALAPMTLGTKLQQKYSVSIYGNASFFDDTCTAYSKQMLSEQEHDLAYSSVT